MAIQSVAISNSQSNKLSISSRWGITACEYKLGGKQVDLQDLMVAVSKHRAVAVEGEVAPQATRIRERNKRLDTLGKVLSLLTGLQSEYEKDDKGSTERTHRLSAQPDSEVISELDSLGISLAGGLLSGSVIYMIKAPKAKTEESVQRVKAMIDGLNNEAQMDMSRLQQLVDRRDESFSTATNLMTAISDTRSNLIRAL